MSGGGGTERLARRQLKKAKALAVPVMPDKDAKPISRLELARSAGFEPDEWQRLILESEARKFLLLCSRQSGKSLTSALLAVHEACTNYGALVLMVSPSQKQSSELFRKCMDIVKTATVPLPKIRNESTLKLELENGSRIIALPGNEETVRGYSAATLLVVDEAALVSNALMAAISPTLATTDGRLIALSTPHGKRGWFYEEWVKGEGWERTRIEAKDCSRIGKKFLAEQLQRLGPHVYEQEYNCQFYDPDTAVFSSELIERALGHGVKPLWPVAA
jgi:Terminase large subunit, T4likevirus-type, N-terminal